MRAKYASRSIMSGRLHACACGGQPADGRLAPLEHVEMPVAPLRFEQFMETAARRRRSLLVDDREAHAVGPKLLQQLRGVAAADVEERRRQVGSIQEGRTGRRGKAGLDQETGVARLAQPCLARDPLDER